MEKTALIVGSGTCAQRIAKSLILQGIDVILTSEDQTIELGAPSDAIDQHPGSLEVLTATEVLACQGFIGNFQIWLRRSETTIHRNAAIVIIAVDYHLKPNHALYNLKPGDFVYPLSRLKDIGSGHPQLNKGDVRENNIAFLSGLRHESDPVIHNSIMLAALELQLNFEVQTYIFTGNLKVAANGLEPMSHALKKAGGIIVKFSNSRPGIQQHNDGRVELEFLDEVTREHFTLIPDLTVVDETICPSPYIRRLSHILALDTDRFGFMQTANTRRLPVHTNRTGILAAGPSRAVQSPADDIVDADAAALTALELLSGGLPKTPTSAEINTGKCVRCLTCLRLCPHRAVSFDAQLRISSDDCQGCGLCVSECPAVAIGQPDLPNDPMDSLCLNISKQQEVAVPSIVAFCCSRSAARAADLARCMGYELPPGLHIIEVPCACSISMEYILTAFAGNAEGVLVMSCHEGNCHSEKGTGFARNRTKQIARFLDNAGASSKRLKMHTLAANMGKDFYEITNQWDQQLSTMEPLRS